MGKTFLVTYETLKKWKGSGNIKASHFKTLFISIDSCIGENYMHQVRTALWLKEIFLFEEISVFEKKTKHTKKH